MLGDCKCLKTDEKIDLRRAITLLSNYFDGLAAFGDKSAYLKYTILNEDGLIKTGDVLDRIRNTPTCYEKGGISKECSCFSNLEREVLKIGLKGLIKIEKNRNLSRREYNLINQIESIKKSCMKP